MASMQPDTRYAKSGDIHIAYQVTGAGAVDLVIAPGTASHLDLDWEWPEKARFLTRLGSFCRLIRFDKRGTGLSDRPTDAATLEQRTDDIRAVMERSRARSRCGLRALGRRTDGMHVRRDVSGADDGTHHLGDDGPLDSGRRPSLGVDYRGV